MQRRRYRLAAGAAALAIALGAGLATAGSAWSAPGHGHSPHNPVLRIDQSLHQIQLTIPAPACPPADAGCTWMLYVGEPRVAGRPTVAAVTGSSGTLTIPFPVFCGVIQADALIGPAPWTYRAGIRRTIDTCTSPPGPVPAGPVPAGTQTALPFTSGPDASVASTGSPAANGTPSGSAAQLPFTGFDLQPLFLIGTGLVLSGGALLLTVESQRRALRRALRGETLREGAHRTGLWFFGL